MRAHAAIRAALAAVLASGLDVPLTEAERARYRLEPVEYARERLGVVMMPHQAAVAYAAAGQWHRITDEMRELAQLKNEGKRKIAIRSCQKAGKSALLICLALWFFECFDAAKFLLTAAQGNQIKTVLWHELKAILREAPHAPGGRVSADPLKGMASEDESRVILGFTGRNAESVAGQSGNLMIAVDEASALEDEKAEAVFGNRLGSSGLGSPVLLFANPTRPAGPFYEAFHGSKENYTTAHFDGEKIAAWNARQANPVPYVISLAGIAEALEEHGRESPFYQVRVLGNFLAGETGKCIPMAVIAAAQERWRELWLDQEGEPLKGRALEARRAIVGKTKRFGTLRIGFDPASEKLRRDESGFAVVRGLVCIESYTRRGLTTEQGLAELWRLMAKYRTDDEMPELAVDVEGDIGNEYRLAIAAEAERRRIHQPGDAFAFHAVRSSSQSVRDRRLYLRVRAELWGALADWAKVAAIPPNGRLETELYTANWIPLKTAHTDVTSKETFRELIHRSPDLADALCLAVYQGAGTDGGGVSEQLDDYAQGGELSPIDANAVFYGDGAPEPGEGEPGDPSDPFTWGEVRRLRRPGRRPLPRSPPNHLPLAA